MFFLFFKTYLLYSFNLFSKKISIISSFYKVFIAFIPTNHIIARHVIEQRVDK